MLLNVQNLKIKYNDTTIINNMNFSVNKGDKVVIIGQSGCGKSSILKAIIKAIEYEGMITLSGNVAYVPQNLALLEHKTVEQNVNLPLTSKTDVPVADDEYRKFKLEQLKEKYVSKLSGGERQRVALMRALYSKRKLLLFDEPLSKIDALTKEEIIKYFNHYITNEFGLIYITHDLNEAIAIGNQIIVVGKTIEVIENQGDKFEMEKKLKIKLKE